MGGYPNTTMNPTPSPTGGGNFPWSGLLSGLGSIAGNIISNKGALRREKDRRNYDTKQWERVTAYNHPRNQMARLAEAGLNPNLIYGSSPGSAVGNAGAIPTGKAPEYRIDNPVGPFMDATVKQAQSNNLKSQSDLNDMNALKSMEDTKLTKVQRKLAEGTIFSNIEARRYESEKIKQQYLQERLKTNLMSDKKVGIVAQKMIEIDKLKYEGATQFYKAKVAALSAFLRSNGIPEGSPWWAEVIGLVSGLQMDSRRKQNWEENKRQFELWLKDPSNIELK